MDRLDNSCALASLGYLDRNELAIPGIPTDLARMELLSHVASPPFSGRLPVLQQVASAILWGCTVNRRCNYRARLAGLQMFGRSWPSSLYLFGGRSNRGRMRRASRPLVARGRHAVRGRRAIPVDQGLPVHLRHCGRPARSFALIASTAPRLTCRLRGSLLGTHRLRPKRAPKTR